jgi:hypothetical protein
VVATLKTRRAARLLWLASLVLGVAMVHGCIIHAVVKYAAAQQNKQDPTPERMQAIYVQTMQPMVPVEAAVAALPEPFTPKPSKPKKTATPLQAVAKAASVASQPEPALPAASEPTPEPIPPPEPASAPQQAHADSPTPASAPASTPTEPDLATQIAAQQPAPKVVPDASETPDPFAGSASGAAFEWPVATRLKFNLTGNYKGDIQGLAQVEWLRQQDRYQVHLDVAVGLPFAPLMSRRMSSQGRITRAGLVPDRFDQQTKFAFQSPQHVTLLMESDEVVFPAGQRQKRPLGLQDSASQFVQLSWRLSTRPKLLVPGKTIEVPLALPRQLDRIIYDIGPSEILETSFGKIPVHHLTPRQKAQANGNMSVEMWIAPQYRHLPIRLRIHQDADTYVDLLISRPPEVGASVETTPQEKPP